MDKKHWSFDWYKFTDEMRIRMEEGEDEYGDASFQTDPAETVREIQEELLDVANWSFILWCKMDKLVL